MIEQKQTKKRFLDLDFLRSLAIIGMIFYHFFFILNYYEIYGVDFENVTVRFFAQLVRFDFLALVGVGMVISYYRVLNAGRGRLRAILQQWKRGVMVGGCALIVTLATYWFISEEFVRFGILHLIAVSIVFWSFFVEKKWIVLGLSVVYFWIGGWFSWIGLGGVDFGHLGADKTVVENFKFAYFLRDMMWNVEALDYFPLFPWMGITGVGIFLGHVFYPGGNPRFKRESSFGDARSSRGRGGFRLLWELFLRMGRHSLLIYVLHVPIIVVVLWALNLVQF